MMENILEQQALQTVKNEAEGYLWSGRLAGLTHSSSYTATLIIRMSEPPSLNSIVWMIRSLLWQPFTKH